MAAEGAGLTQLLEGRSWVGKAGWATAQELVDGFLEFWRKNEAILRVVDLGAAEGDKRFYKIRMKILNSVNNSLADSVSELQSKGKVDKDVNAAAIAGSSSRCSPRWPRTRRASRPGASSKPNSSRTWRCWCTWGDRKKTDQVARPHLLGPPSAHVLSCRRQSTRGLPPVAVCRGARCETA